MSCYALMACSLGDPGWGIPGFRMVLCCFTHTSVWRCDDCVVVLSLLFCHTNSGDDTMLSPLTHHLVAELACRSLSCFLLWCVFWFVCCLFCCLVVFFAFLLCGVIVTAHRTMYRSSTSSLLRPLNQQTAMAMRSLINSVFLCNMQSNVLDDLVEAKRRRKEKN